MQGGNKAALPAHLTQWIYLLPGRVKWLEGSLRNAYALQTVFDDEDIGKFMSYDALYPSYRVFVASLQTISISKDWKTAK
jgi:hypothetical protein